ncbi:hypothetical protein B0H14DRAFT_3166128 [Mycena olivaceomarginata]|nr:hypothetical protein B0H14DRAFT_3166128 [Mycena olivaceomarginata]
MLPSIPIPYNWPGRGEIAPIKSRFGGEFDPRNFRKDTRIADIMSLQPFAEHKARNAVVILIHIYFYTIIWASEFLQITSLASIPSRPTLLQWRGERMVWRSSSRQYKFA